MWHSGIVKDVMEMVSTFCMASAFYMLCDRHRLTLVMFASESTEN